MNRFEERLSHTLKGVRMDAADRARLRERLVLAMDPSSRASSPVLRRNIKRTMPIALLIAMLLSGSVSYAAEGSLPGDTLYPIKIHVNENVKGAIALSAEAKAEHEADLAEERLREAEELRNEARLATSTKDELRASFLEHRSRANEHLDDFRSSDATSATAVSASFENRFGRHGEHHEALIELGIASDDEDGSDDHEGDRREDDDRSGIRLDVGASGTLRIEGEDHSHGEDRSGESSKIESRSETHLEIEDDHRGKGDDEESDEDDDDRGSIVPGIVSPVLVPNPTPTPSTSGGASAKTYTLLDIASHNSSASCYTAISGSVYDLTSFIPGHPGGSVILSVCGKDGTALFSAQHAGAGKPASALANLKIGVLAN